MKKKKILILSMIGGFGHIRAGEALLDYAKEYVKDVEAHHVDISDINLSLKEYAKVYDLLVKRFPLAWKVIYSYLPAALVQKAVSLEGRVSNKVKEYVEKENPDVIIFTNVTILPMFLATFRKSLPNTKMAVTVTDYHGHPYYVFKELDYYFVAHEKVKEELVALGAETEKIVVSGIPVNPRFYVKEDVGELRQQYGIKNGLPIVVFITSFKATKKEIASAIRQLLEYTPEIYLVVIANGNAIMFNFIQKTFGSHERLQLVNWTNRIEEYIKMSSLVISKAGGLTVSECLAVHKPIIMVRPIPGQEDHNAAFMEENHFGKRVNEVDQIVPLLPEFLSQKAVDTLLPVENPCEKIYQYFT